MNQGDLDSLHHQQRRESVHPVTSRLWKSSIHKTVTVIPGGCTCILQPLNALLYKPFKVHSGSSTFLRKQKRQEKKEKLSASINQLVKHAWRAMCCTSTSHSLSQKFQTLMEHPYSKWSAWNMHVSCMSQHISCAQIQKVSCMKFPVTILNSLKFHECYMHDSRNMHVTCRDLGRFQVWDMHVTCMDWWLNFMHVSCMEHAWNMHEKYAYFMHETCMFQAYSMHDTGIFHVWYRRIPCVVLGYSMQACVHHAQYSYRHNIIPLDRVQSNLDYPNLDYPNPWLSELEIQRKCRVKVHIVTTCPDCACAVNLRRVVATREPAAALLSNLVLTLNEVKETQGKCSINRGRD